VPAAAGGVGAFLAHEHYVSLLGLAGGRVIYDFSAFAIRKPTVYNLASSKRQNLSHWSLGNNPEQKYLVLTTLSRQIVVQGAQSRNINT
jgi:hypothetical protein